MRSDSPIIEPRLQTLSRKSFWQRHVNQWRTSGLSKMAYCRQYSLAYHQMVYWSSKEQKPVADQSEKSSGFVAVTVAAAASDQSLSVRLPNGVMIEGINDRSVALVGMLLEQL
jgi:hypothetical protein